MAEVNVHNSLLLQIKHTTLWAVQIEPENLPRIFNMFQDWAISYEAPKPETKRPPKLTLAKTATKFVSGDLLDYLVWGPGVELHVVKAEDFGDIYTITEEIK